jgi:hypothetical protein
MKALNVPSCLRAPAHGRGGDVTNVWKTFAPPSVQATDGMHWPGKRSWMRSAASAGWGFSKPMNQRQGRLARMIELRGPKAL